MASSGRSNPGRYRVFGLTIESDLPFPGLPPSHAKPDLMLEACGPCEASENEEADHPFAISGAPNRLHLSFRDILSMDIQDGATIRYHRHAGTSDAELRLFLLGSGLGAALMQRGQTVIHANAVVLPDSQAGAILCMGASGVGKSTLAFALAQAGARVLSDDVCAIGSDDLVQPGIAKVKLWEDAADQFVIDTSGLNRVRPSDAKFHVPLDGAYCTSPQPIAGAFWLEPAEVEQVSVARVDGLERFAMLRNNVYRPEFLRPLGLEAVYLEKLSKLAKSIPMFRVLRPKEGFAINELVDTILAVGREELAGPAPRPVA